MIINGTNPRNQIILAFRQHISRMTNLYKFLNAIKDVTSNVILRADEQRKFLTELPQNVI